MITYVTGFHRAGTHEYAEKEALKKSLLYVEEKTIGLNNLNAVQKLKQGKLPTGKLQIGKDKEEFVDDSRLAGGFVLQCPFLAHEVESLSADGEVIWCVRDFNDMLYSLKRMDFRYSAWEVVKGFHAKYPQDQIWTTAEYDGRDDMLCNFVGYYAVMIKIKEYFYDKYFKNLVILVKLENQPYYDASVKKEILYKKHEQLQIDRQLNLWEKRK